MAYGDDNEREQPQPPRRFWIIPGPNRPTARDTTLPAPPEVLPRTSAATPPPEVPAPPTTLAERLRARESYLTGKLNPPQKTGWGRVGQVLGTIGQDVGTAIAPGVMERIPGTTMNRRAELQDVREALGEEQMREATAGEAAARTGIEQQRVDVEREKAGLPHIVPGSEYTAGGRRFDLWEKPGVGTGYAETGGPPPSFERENAGGLPQTALAPQTQPGPPGTLPRVMPQQPMYGSALPPGGVYGKPAEKQTPLSEEQIRAQNAQSQQLFQQINPGKTMPADFLLKPGATQEDLGNVRSMLEATERAAATETQRVFLDQQKREQAAREAEAARERNEQAGAKPVMALDNAGKRHLMSFADYDAHRQDFQPNPIAVAPGEYDKAIDHTTTINEMQGRMNAAAEAAMRFDFKNTGQKQIVMQALETVDKNYADNLIGIPIMRFVADNLKKLGLEGALPETREYIIDMLSLREAMLGMPKEITGGSRMMEKAVEALWSTLPSGVTPDRPWAMDQLRAAQTIIDRLRGTRVPIVEGVTTIPKVPDLYKYSATNPKTRQQIFSDDKKTWVDEDGKPIAAR